MKIRHIVAAAAALLMTFSLKAQDVPQWEQVPEPVNDARYQTAKRLYEAGLWSEARTRFGEVADAWNNPWTQGYIVLCSAKMRSPGYNQLIYNYIREWSYSGLLPQIYHQYGLNLFEEGDYVRAYDAFTEANPALMDHKAYAEYHFKKAYCLWTKGDAKNALEGFSSVAHMSRSDYSAPSQYMAGYICYEKHGFEDAENWFSMSEKDPRFNLMSRFYITECRYLGKDYNYVVKNGPELYEEIAEARKPHLARIISESYLVKGDAEKAKKYYDVSQSAGADTRADYFYAGSLLYTLKDWNGAVDKFTKMTDRTDSIGQVANYDLGYSYIQLRNKVAAMESFHNAAAVGYDADIQEDAAFNYAKLAFDLNHDSSAFKEYISKYADKAKGEKIYSYMALAALYNHDYAGALEAYDKIDELEGDLRDNYMKANYLRANQLIRSGSWRSAEPCLKAAAWYSEKGSPVNQLSRYWLAESYFRDDNFAEARTEYNNLYNISALDGRAEGNRLAYDVAYCYYKQEDWANAAKWFSNYIAQGNGADRKDAMVRKADCYFINKDYKDAAAAYDEAVRYYPDMTDLYPYYQAGMSYGLAKDAKTKIARLEQVKKASSDVPFWSEAMFELGKSYASQKKETDAENCYKSIVSANVDKDYVARSLTSLGLMAKNARKYDEALGYYKQIVEEMPECEYAADALSSIESVYRSKQEPQAYTAYLESLGAKAASMTSDDSQSVLFYSAEQIYLNGNWTKALAALQAYEEKYPQGENIAKAEYYMAECFRNTDKKDQACDYFKKAMNGNDASLVELSALAYAGLSYEMDHYADALEGYRKLSKSATTVANRFNASVGVMRSAYKAKEYEAAIAAANVATADKSRTYEERMIAAYIAGKSYMETSQRDKALASFRTISSSTSAPEGAEAAYILIQDAYDRGDFEQTESLVYKFAESGSKQDYWKAKAFITLGDSFADRDQMAQAKATFESIRDGYTPRGTDDDVLDQVNMRLSKLQ